MRLLTIDSVYNIYQFGSHLMVTIVLISVILKTVL